MSNKPILETDFPELQLIKRGKVRDIYDLDDKILMIATDRISAYDVIMPNPVPGKGEILTQISLFWFKIMEEIVPNHLISSNVDDYPDSCKPYADALNRRSMLVKKATPLPIECVVRGYISGSGWKSYQKSGEICGIKLPAGLKESDQLAEPIFTPSTKEELGAHDINIDFDKAVNMVGNELAEQVRDLSISIYKKGAELAAEKGIIIADTKFEFGIIKDQTSQKDQLILIDEVLTPDSSRFWPKQTYQPGGPQNSFDKQYLRDYLISIKWDKNPPAPSLPEEVIQNTYQKYMEALTFLTRTSLTH
ncbi:MAG: phosphoribosylaminoimidazolesuccinocarboxamide synthase [Desulfobacteraceae bacterium]|nr:phosphoribosylaminoimidazolesuccinocarboxamide synthase [Desulfobacteraceae bacterium]